MTVMKRKYKTIVILVLFFLFLLPLSFYWFVIGKEPSLNSEESLKLLKDGQGVLVDVRDSIQYSAGHIDGSMNLPLKKINTFHSKEELPPVLKGKKIMLICSSGITSTFGVKKLKGLSVDNVFSVTGGLQLWTSSLDLKSACVFQHLLNNNIPSEKFQDISKFEQLIAVIAAFVVKPIYLLMSLIFFIFIRKMDSIFSKSLAYSLLFFFLGEMFCAVNYLFYSEHSYLFEYLHIYGMAFSFSFFAFAVLESLDKRVIQYSAIDKKCSLLGLCKSCYKYDEISCKLRSLFIFLIIVIIILSFIPIISSISPISYNASIFGSKYNYSHPTIFQMLEFKIFPLISLFFFVLTIITISIDKKNISEVSKYYFAGGIGFLGFGVFRLIFYKTFTDNLTWFVVGEEVTELLYILFIGIAVYLFKPEVLKIKTGVFRWKNHS
jgi:rhodanese-related sulfurtransferase